MTTEQLRLLENAAIAAGYNIGSLSGHYGRLITDIADSERAAHREMNPGIYRAMTQRLDLLNAFKHALDSAYPDLARKPTQPRQDTNGGQDGQGVGRGQGWHYGSAGGTPGQGESRRVSYRDGTCQR